MRALSNITLFLTIVLFNSCNIHGFYSGYKKLEDSQKKRVQFIPPGESICNKTDKKEFAAIQAAHLKKCLEKSPKAIVYTWSPHCHSESCLLVSAVQDYCTKKNYELFVVADYYDWDIMKGQNVAIHPMLVINHKYYKTDYANKYQAKFMQELLADSPTLDNKSFGRYYVFEKGKCIEVRAKLF